MNQILVTVICLGLTGCASLTVGTRDSPPQVRSQGLLNSYLAFNGFRPYDRTFIDAGILSDNDRWGSIASLDIWPIGGMGVSFVGARMKLLPFEIGVGVLGYEPEPECYKKSREKLACDVDDIESTEEAKGTDTTVLITGETSVGKNFSAPPTFSREGFEAVVPGMSGDEVRELIGPPICRYRVGGAENEVEWEYSRIGTIGQPWTEFLVVCDENGVVLFKKVSQFSDSSGKLTPFKLECPSHLPDIELKLIDEGTIRLDETADGVTFVETFRKNAGPWRWQNLRTRLPRKSSDARFQVVLVCVDEQALGAERYAEEPLWRVAVAHDPDSQLLSLFDLEFPGHALVLDQGTVVPFHDLILTGWKSEYLDDLFWTINNCLKKQDLPD